jgi:hypothetical protein
MPQTNNSAVLAVINQLGYPADDLSLAQAQAVLKELTASGTKIVAPDALKDLANRVLADASGEVTVLYGGKIDGVGAGTYANKLADTNSEARVIKNTPAAAFLTDPLFETAVGETFGIDPKYIGDRTKGGAANTFMEATDGLWGDISERFIDKARGSIIGFIRLTSKV